MFNISFDDETRERLKRMQYVGRQVGRALSYFTRSVAEEVKLEIERMGRVPGVDYGELEVVYFGKVGRMNVSALVLPGSMSTVGDPEKGSTVVTVSPNTESPFLRLMQQKSPWPLTMLPPNFQATKKASLVSRNVSIEEVEVQAARLLGDKEVYPRLVEWGYISDTDSRAAQTEDLMRRVVPDFDAQEDVAWKVLRHEFGLGGNPSVPHWRKSLKSASVDIDEEVLYGFFSIITGEKKEGIPRKNVSLMGEMRAVGGFQEYVTSSSAAQSGDPRR